MADEEIPVIGHVGLIPSRKTWTGGFKAVGKTADAALEIFEAVQQLRGGRARSAPRSRSCRWRSRREIAERTSLFMLSMGAGAGCDAQYLFAEDMLGANRGHMPRHSKVYRNFAAEYRPVAGASGSRRSPNMSPTSKAAPIPSRATSCTWRRRSWIRRSGAGCAAAGLIVSHRRPRLAVARCAAPRPSPRRASPTET